MLLLVTRPQAEAERTAEALRARGHEALIAPVLHIEAVADVQIAAARHAAVLMTSGNAARAVAAHPQRDRFLQLPVFAVGRQTARAAADAGFATVVSADGDATDLARLVQERSQLGGRLLYLAGSDISRDLAGELGRKGLSVDTVVVYRAVAADSLPGPARMAIETGRLDGVMHYSRRSANIFLDCLRGGELIDRVTALRHYCLSARAAEPLRAAGCLDVRIAAGPRENAMLDLLDRR